MGLRMGGRKTRRSSDLKPKAKPSLLSEYREQPSHREGSEELGVRLKGNEGAWRDVSKTSGVAEVPGALLRGAGSVTRGAGSVAAFLFGNRFPGAAKGPGNLMTRAGEALRPKPKTKPDPVLSGGTDVSMHPKVVEAAMADAVSANQISAFMTQP